MGDRALFLDRDGVINREVGYLVRKEQVQFVNGIFPLCQTAIKLGYRLVIVTNQAGIARGLYTEAEYQALMQWMRGKFSREGIHFGAIYHCPYHPVHGVGDYKREQEDRKPGAGMLRRASRDLNITLSRSVMVGDRCTDIAAANTGGLRQAFLLRGTEGSSCTGSYMTVDSLDQVISWLLEDQLREERRPTADGA
jgi:D-glycero-D-manno-heptose 1,7-bisphosphate phosphatase